MGEDPVISQHVSHSGWGSRWGGLPTFSCEWLNGARVRMLGPTARSPTRGRKCPKNRGCFPPERSLRQTARIRQLSDCAAKALDYGHNLQTYMIM